MQAVFRLSALSTTPVDFHAKLERLRDREGVGTSGSIRVAPRKAATLVGRLSIRVKEPSGDG